MKVKEVEISLGMTLSPRQYESVRVDGRVLVELADGDLAVDAFATARAKLNEQVEEQMAQTLTRLGVGPGGKPANNGTLIK